MLGMGRRIGEWHLVRPEGAFDLQAIDDLRTRPALRRIEDDHRPARPNELAMEASVLLDGLDLLHRRVERYGHGLMHRPGLVALDENGRPAIPAEELLQFLAGDP